MNPVFRSIRNTYLGIRARFLPLYRFGYLVSMALRYNPYTGFFGRRLFRYIPFLLPHDKSYYGFLLIAKKESGLFLDIGANDGISAIGFRHINRNYDILSLEPNLCHEPSLRRVKKRIKKFDYITAAAGKEPGEMTLYIPLYKGIPIHSAASFSVDFIKSTMQKQFPDHEKENLVCLQHPVKVIRVDDLELSPDIVKIDTEGHDHEVLLGLTATIQKHRPYFLVEFNPAGIDKIVEFFKNADYTLLTYDIAKKIFVTFDLAAGMDRFKTDQMAMNIFAIPKEKTDTLPIFSKVL